MIWCARAASRLGKHGDSAREEISAHPVEDGIDWLTPVLARVADHLVGAQSAHEVGLDRRTHPGDDPPDTPELGELDGEVPYAARGPGDQDRPGPAARTPPTGFPHADRCPSCPGRCVLHEQPHDPVPVVGPSCSWPRVQATGGRTAFIRTARCFASCELTELRRGRPRRAASSGHNVCYANAAVA